MNKQRIDWEPFLKPHEAAMLRESRVILRFQVRTIRLLRDRAYQRARRNAMKGGDDG